MWKSTTPRRRPHRRLILREIALRALREQELLPTIEEEEGEGSSTAEGEQQPNKETDHVWPFWSRLTSFAGGVRSGWRDIDIWSDYVLSGNLLYVVASVFYVWCNYSRGYLDSHAMFTDVLYIVLAFAFVVDAVLYHYSWQGAWPPPGWVAIWSDYINIIASVGYLCTACLYIVETSEQMVQAVMLTEAAMALLFVVDSLMYTYAWITTVPPQVKGRGCTLRDLDLWAYILFIVPACLYMMSAIVGIWMHWTQRRQYIGGEAGSLTSDPADIYPSGVYPALKLMSRINVWADVLYLADAVVLCASWWRDLMIELAPVSSSGIVVKLRIEDEDGSSASSGADRGRGGSDADSVLEGDGWLHSSEGVVPPTLVRRASIIVAPVASMGAGGRDDDRLLGPLDRKQQVTPILTAPDSENGSSSGGGSATLRRSYKLPKPITLQSDAAGTSGVGGGRTSFSEAARPLSISVTSVDVETSSIAAEALSGALEGHRHAAHFGIGHPHEHHRHRYPPIHEHGLGAAATIPLYDAIDDDDDGYDVCSPCKTAWAGCSRLLCCSGRCSGRGAGVLTSKPSRLQQLYSRPLL